MPKWSLMTVHVPSAFPPMHFGGVPSVPKGAASELGQHTEEILLELGHDWDASSEQFGPAPSVEGEKMIRRK